MFIEIDLRDSSLVGGFRVMYDNDARYICYHMLEYLVVLPADRHERFVSKPLCHGATYHHRPAAYLAIFNIFLFGDRCVDKQFYRFAAVGAERFFEALWNH